MFAKIFMNRLRQRAYQSLNESLIKEKNHFTLFTVSATRLLLQKWTSSIFQVEWRASSSALFPLISERAVICQRIFARKLERCLPKLIPTMIKSHPIVISHDLIFILITFSGSQIEYDPGFMYDVSLQIESEFNGDVKSIVPAEHKKHRHKWVWTRLDFSANKIDTHFSLFHRECQTPASRSRAVQGAEEATKAENSRTQSRW